MNDPLYKVFVEWFSTPIAKRKEKSVAEWAENYGATRQQVISYYEHPNFFDDVNEACMNWGLGRIPEYLAKLDEKIRLKGSTRDMIAFMDILEKLNKKKANQGQIAINISDERAETILRS